jgi:Domain of unknown function (DUF5925)/ATPase family associated with various cellular activities (AAA)
MTPMTPEEVTVPYREPVQAGMFYNLSDADTSDLANGSALVRMRNLPEWREKALPFKTEPAELLPEDATVVLNLRGAFQDILVAEGPGFVVRVRSTNQATTVLVAAMSAADADGILQASCEKAERPPAPNSVPFTLWRQRGGRAASWQRELEVPEWDSIARNYPMQGDLETLMRLPSVAGTGRLLLWTGAPGTGKTWAIRALARSWHGWCKPHLIIDPEKFFEDAAYLLEVMSEQDDPDDPAGPRARLIICEDADDFIRARERTGSGVGRLLNVADGLLGQGLNNIILLTANAPVQRLDPALVRPGRLLANLEFGRFTAAEARSWLGDAAAAVPSDGCTLAELYEMAGSVTRTVSAPRATVETGAYL